MNRLTATVCCPANSTSSSCHWLRSTTDAIGWATATGTTTAFAFRLGRPAPPMLIGYGFDEQQIERVVNHSGDVPLDCIITPTKVVRPVDR